MLKDCNEEPRSIEEICFGERRISGIQVNELGIPYKVYYCGLSLDKKNGCSFQSEFPYKNNGLYGCDKLGEGCEC
jgi:hypothetical protein